MVKLTQAKVFSRFERHQKAKAAEANKHGKANQNAAELREKRLTARQGDHPKDTAR